MCPLTQSDGHDAPGLIDELGSRSEAARSLVASFPTLKFDCDVLKLELKIVRFPSVFFTLARRQLGLAHSVLRDAPEQMFRSCCLKSVHNCPAVALLLPPSSVSPSMSE